MISKEDSFGSRSVLIQIYVQINNVKRVLNCKLALDDTYKTHKEKLSQVNRIIMIKIVSKNGNLFEI